MRLCKATLLLSSWEAMQMRAGAGAPPPASFDDYVISYMGEVIASATETSIWAGVANAGGDFIGFHRSRSSRMVKSMVMTQQLIKQ